MTLPPRWAIPIVSVVRALNPRFIAAEAESTRGPVPLMGNSITRAKVKGNINKFVVDWAKAGNTHHLSLCLGHIGNAVEKLCSTLPGITYKYVE